MWHKIKCFITHRLINRKPKNRLYIIGNGFDLHHGIPSSYSDFKEYLLHHNQDLKRQMENRLGGEGLWSKFEEALADLDAQRLMNEVSHLQPNLMDEHPDYHEAQDHCNTVVKTLTKDLKSEFSNWIFQLKLPDTAHKKKICVCPDSQFITFNYTDTLQRLYKVKDGNIIYLHGSKKNNSDIIIGHSRKPSKELTDQYDNENYEYYTIDAARKLDKYFETNYKQTEQIIKTYQTNFKEFCNLKEVYILGHSLSKVDWPYFKEVIKRIDRKKVIWKVSYYKQEDIQTYKEILHNKLNIPLNNIELKKLNCF